MTDRYDVVVVGGGPAGSMTAFHLASAGMRVVLLEEKRMPRGKVCGEFITPEALPFLERAGLIDTVIRAGAKSLTRLVLCPMNGRRVEAPISSISNTGGSALSLSRKRLDAILFEKAQAGGATCIQRVSVRGAIRRGSFATGVEALSLSTGKPLAFHGDVVVDASGRSSRLAPKKRSRPPGRERLYAMKAHFSGVNNIDRIVGLLFFPNGYGGISQIEGDLANVCFIAPESIIRKHRGDGASVLADTMMMNPAGREWLTGSRVEEGWLTVGPLSFGPGRLANQGVLAVGDAAGMNDPFTGTGIMIAIRGAELAATAIVTSLGAAGSGEAAIDPVQAALLSYKEQYSAQFGSLMTAAAGLRRAAFSPRIANIVAGAFTRIPDLMQLLLQRTRTTSAHFGTFGSDRRVLE
ncbi:MAG TPA: FAD-dependent oxidoreductase [Blastocatellia bacterium]|nr:FAD-dependent oxidoreductase [Blastocatellia bacterium]